MDSLTISPDVMHQMAKNAGAGVALESLQNANEQVQQINQQAEQKPDSATDPGVGESVDVKA
jgi:flagellar biosynthesis chaperone FliJ